MDDFDPEEYGWFYYRSQGVEFDRRWQAVKAAEAADERSRSRGLPTYRWGVMESNSGWIPHKRQFKREAWRVQRFVPFDPGDYWRGGTMEHLGRRS